MHKKTHDIIKLNNDIRVILEPIDHAEVIALYVGVAVGSADESVAHAGICHLIEHMFFKGTKNYGPGEIATLVESWGGNLNAFTSHDATVYYMNLPNRFLFETLELMGQMLTDPILDPLELEREKEVVCEEIRKGKDEPQRLLFNNLHAAAYAEHPYGRDIIGHEKSVRGFKRETIRAFLTNYYRGGEIFIGIAGGFDAQKIYPAIEKAFGAIPPGTKPTRPVICEKPITTARGQITSKQLNTAYFQLGYHIPALDHEDVAALEILSHWLGERPNSFLEEIFIHQKRLTNQIYSYSYTPKEPGLFVIGGSCEPKKLEKVLKAWTMHLPQALHKLNEEALSLARHNLISQKIFQEQTASGRCRKSIMLATATGDPNYDIVFANQLKQVALSDVTYVFEKYLLRAQPAYSLLVPQNSRWRPEKANTILARKPALVPQKQKPAAAKIYQLAPGIELIAECNRHSPLVAIHAVTAGGTLYENKKSAGMDNLISELVSSGTQLHTRQELAHAMERISGDISGFSGRNSFGLAAQFLSEYLSEGMSLFTEIWLKPVFTRDEFEKEREMVLVDLKQRRDSPVSQTIDQMYELLYGAHPYSLPASGLESSLKSLKRTQLIPHYQKRLRGQKWHIAVVGDIDPDLIAERIEKLLSHKIGRHNKQPAPPPAPQIPQKQRFRHLHSERAQSHLVVGFLGSTVRSSDRYALDVLTQILSGQGGRLFIELRDKKSLAYSVGAIHMEGLQRGVWGVYIGCDPQKTQEAYDNILLELEKVVKQPPGVREMERAKEYLKGSHQLSNQLIANVSNRLALNRLYQISLAEISTYPKKIDAVDFDQVVAVGKKYLTIEKPVVSLVAPSSVQLKF